MATEKKEIAKKEPEIDIYANYPGIPQVVTSEDAAMLKEHHPQYEVYKPIIDARLGIWKAGSDAAKAHAQAIKAEEKEEQAAPVTGLKVAVKAPAAEKP